MRFSLRLGLILAIAAILASTLLVSAVLTYWHASHKLDVEMESSIATAQRTIRVALQDIADAPSDSRQVARLIRTFDDNRHVRVELRSADGRSLLSSKPAATSGDMPEWFYRILQPAEPTATISLNPPTGTGDQIIVTAVPRNEAGEVWGDVKLHLSTLLLFCVLALAILSALLGYALSPLSRLLAAFDKIGRGRFGEAIPVSGPIELEQLAQGFNRMSSMLSDIESQNRKLDAQLEKLQEEERASLARDLHDEVGPLLFSIDVDATTIRGLADQEMEPRVGERASAILDAVAQVKEQVRNILWQLRPGLLLDLGLRNALENLISSFKARHPGVSFTLQMSDQKYTSVLSATLLAITREAVQNAIKHGQPQSVEVRITHTGTGYIELTVRDDGGGLSSEGRSGSLGVISMRERAEMAGGTIDISNISGGKGVEVRLVVPSGSTAERSSTSKLTSATLQ